MAAAVMGFLIVATGMVVFMYSFANATLSPAFIGCALIFAALVQNGFARISRCAGNFMPKTLIAMSYLVAGVAVVALPANLRVIVGGLLTLEAVVETVVATEVPRVIGRQAFAFSAAWTLMLGLLVFSDLPNSADWLIGAALGLAVVLNGISRIVISAMVDEANDSSKGRVRAA